ncbi:hypothetical protein BS47DRAFT_1325747 [Hydnum rufescens UP504]|uniref:NACHT domain-containing protein n=1 Tax=Hydnum rufescens UP504 TaxID=1448309 RepID=A0A9P6B5G7_9AGAM|nr:hypothetical protein BS47DRAFT_1325747 [Hydnum rufescens UP504]
MQHITHNITLSTITTGHGGHGENGGTGGRAGDIYFGSGGTSLLMALPHAPYAAHDSFREDAPSSCLVGTRVAVLEEISTWSESANGERPPIYWLNGVAGIGKSTIAKTVAERAQEKRMLGATFFFSRKKESLWDPALVLPTLAFQLAQSDDAFRNVIVDAIERDSEAGRKTLLSQLQKLILSPLLTIDPRRSPILIVLDALDECEENGATNILELMFTHLIRIPFLRILITSRPQPHLSSVFNKASSLAETALHDIDASVVDQDIRLYISTELAKIPRKLGLDMPTDWATEAEKNALDTLVKKSGKLFVYAAVVIGFIGDGWVRDPQFQLGLILNTWSLKQAQAKPYSPLDKLYMEVLRKSLSPFNHQEILKRFQTVVGSIVLLRELLPLPSLAVFVCYTTHVVEESLRHFHSVIIPPSNNQPPRIYHPSFLEFITDPSRCSMREFVIVAVPEQELRHAIRCFELMAKHLKRDIAGISDPSLLNREVDGFKEKVREALSPEVQYACRHWASHLRCVEIGEGSIMRALETFLTQSVLWWFEAMSLLESISNAPSSIEVAHRWADSSRCKPSVVRILSDSHRFILAHRDVIRSSALHVYHSALPFTAHDTMLYKTYTGDGKNSIQVLQGMESKLPRHLGALHAHSDTVTTVAFSPDGLCLASGSSDYTLRLWDPKTGISIKTLKGHSGSVRTIAFSLDGLCLASGSNDYSLRLWDPKTGRLIKTLEGHSGSVRTTAFSPDGLHLASGSDDYTLRLWDPKMGICIKTMKNHHGSVRTIAFSPRPDGLYLASVSDDHTLQLWDGMSGVFIRRLEHDSHQLWELGFSFYHDTPIPHPETLTAQPLHHLPSVITPKPSVAMTPLIWQCEGHWIQVMQQQEGYARRICYIPEDHLTSTEIAVSSQETYSQLAVGCYNGHMIILVVPHDLFPWSFSKEPADTQLMPTVTCPHTPLMSSTFPMNDDPPLPTHGTGQRHAWSLPRLFRHGADILARVVTVKTQSGGGYKG